LPLIFNRGLDLPHFAAFVLLDDEDGREALRSYFRPYIAIARESGVGIVLDTPTWRANADWGAKLDYSADELARTNRRGVALLEELRAEAGDEPTIVIAGCIGPRGDGYRADELMTADDAETYHAQQIATFADTTADLISALTLTYPEEAIGIARAAGRAGMHVALSFTVETDGRLPNGQPLHEAIEQVDAATWDAPAYFMINCAHPTHMTPAFADGGAWIERIHGVRANASSKSHAELDESEELDEGNPAELAAQYRELAATLQNVSIVGGCCGTDHRHIAAVAAAWPR
jgi:S-methylmethionine-dependent homocysteine/selenocysteine methylase